jgi:hypothetical protein
MKKIKTSLNKRKYTILTITIVLLSITSAYGIYSFISTHTFRTPIIIHLQAPIVKKEVHLVSPLQKAKPKGVQKPTTLLQKAEPMAYAATADYKMYIYQHESGNDPKEYNGSGCVGLGQACPGSKLLAVCPNLDYACEDTFFTNYMKSRYGTWYNAYIFWINNNWW